MKLVVDTNIVFSGLLNTNSRIADLLINGSQHFEFYSCLYLQEEINRYQDRIKSLANYQKEEFERLKLLIYEGIQFIEEALIPLETWQSSARLVRELDMDDIAFVALSKFLGNIPLWTGDKKLREGLSQRGFLYCISTEELIKVQEELENKWED